MNPSIALFVGDGHAAGRSPGGTLDWRRAEGGTGGFTAEWLLVAWKEFGQPSSVFVGKDDTIYVGTSFPDPSAKKGELRGIVVGSAKDGSLKAFIPDPADLDTLDAGTSASGIAANGGGNIYAADVAAHNLRRYVKAP